MLLLNWKHQTQSVVNRCDKTRNLRALRSLKQDNKRATSMAAISNMGHQPISFLALWEHLNRKDLQNHHGAVKSWIPRFSFITSLPFFFLTQYFILTFFHFLWGKSLLRVLILLSTMLILILILKLSMKYY